MIIQRIDRATRILHEPPDWKAEEKCQGLPVRDVDVPKIGNFMVSAWTPTVEELAAINAGETIKLWISGTSHPVVCMTVGDIE